MEDVKNWKPKLTLAECDRILMTTPGGIMETETMLIDGRIQRVYKNLAPSLRHLWLSASTLHTNREYIVFENERLTYGEVHRRASRAADVFRNTYGIRKGDHVGIAMRNFPEWVVAWWAIHLLGAVPAAVNAWLPLKALQFCILNTECKLVIVDPERANTLERWATHVTADPETSIQGFLVVRPWEGKGWKGVDGWDAVMKSYKGEAETWQKEPDCVPEDDAAIFFTSGTTGMPKGVLSSQRSFLTNLPNCFAGRLRAALRNGEEIPVPNPNNPPPQVASLIATPLFHVTGTTSTLMFCTVLGNKLIMIRKWNKEEAIQLFLKEKIASMTGVPFTALDLLDSSFPNKAAPLGPMVFVFGGAPPPSTLLRDMLKTFPTSLFGQGYGLTEVNCLAASVAGKDWIARPASTGRAMHVNDLLVVEPETGKVLPPNQPGELWIRGPNVMKGYWKNPEATREVMTKDGWFKTGDLATIDEEGFLYLRGRVKDIIIRGGENIDPTTIENALYNDPRVLECAAVGVPDAKLGELPVAIVNLKEEFIGQVQEQELHAVVKEHLAAFAVPAMIIILDVPMERNAAGKVVKGMLRTMASKVWEKRRAEKAKTVTLSRL